jgi:hypothetical protein
MNEGTTSGGHEHELPEVVPFHSRSGVTLPSMTRTDLAVSGFFSVIVVNTQAAARLDLSLRWNDEIGV